MMNEQANIVDWLDALEITLEEARKERKERIRILDDNLASGKTCNTCKNYRPEAEKCQFIAGIIEPDSYTCVRWGPKEEAKKEGKSNKGGFEFL